MRIVMRNEGGGFAEILRLRSQLFWHSLSHIRRFSPLRMTKQGDARRLTSPSFQRKGREDGLGDARSLKLAVFSYRKPNP